MNVIEKIKQLLNEQTEIKLEQMSLDNGTIIEAETFEPEQPVFIVNEEDRVALPVGEFTLEDGRILVVEVEGIIAAINEAPAEQPAPEEAPAEMSAETFVTKAEFDNLKEMVEKLTMSFEEKKKKVEEVKKEELSADEPENKIVHTPEQKQTKKQIQFSSKKAKSTLDNVFSKINK